MIILIIFIVVVFSEMMVVIKQVKSFKDSWKWLIPIVVGVVGLGYLFKLKWRYLVYLFIMSFLTGLMLLYYNLYYMFYRDEFYKLTQFVLRLSNYYRIYQKENLAFEKAGSDVSLEVYQNHYLINSLMNIIKLGESVSHDKTKYQLRRIEEDIEIWLMDTDQYQKKERHYFNRLLGLFGFSLIIAYITQNMLHHIVDIYVLDMYQFLMLGFLSSILLVVLLAAKRLATSWILEEECI